MNDKRNKRIKKIKKILPGFGLAIFIPLISMAAGNTVDNFIGKNGKTNSNLSELTDEQKATINTEREAKQAEMETKMEAIKSAVISSNYDAWLEAIGSDNKLAEKINSDNFSKYVEAYNLQEQAKNILSELGLEGECIMMGKSNIGDHDDNFGHNRPNNKGIIPFDE
jgi:DNA-directed RNA polymerase subunit N (RpoN/RPB10)